ncbi:hypothetical protein [Desulforhopalus singaporensis]|uniref:DUF106 domain-containing protein n=1 Tax=Desulforhopalus singaporensis TaxID=91360 RepID=A0A1H0QD91_9BACT|nr:hypothetical protein [Desulforhopalus singaporensis]SDP15025.1 hypothetical protein SAMN05660330_01944 [Desulforhopalus singaporensis]
MDTFLDTLWDYLANGFIFAGDTTFSLLQHLHFLGPALLMFLLALVTVAMTKFLNRIIVTRRFTTLEHEFHHWVQVREEAMKCKDREKGGRMARNIDSAELNKAYYDYFFEGLMLGIARKIIPIFFMFAFINEYYRQENLIAHFGSGYLWQLPSVGEQPLFIGAVFWYFISLLICYFLWAVTRRLFRAKPENSGCARHGASPLLEKEA